MGLAAGKPLHQQPNRLTTITWIRYQVNTIGHTVFRLCPRCTTRCSKFGMITLAFPGIETISNKKVIYY
jgi:hypothetical protein